MQNQPHTTASVAAEIGCTQRTVSRFARSEGIGQQVAGVWIFSAGDLRLLRSRIRRGAGRPAKGAKGGKAAG